MSDPDLAAHLVDCKYLLVAAIIVTVAAEAAAASYDGNGTAVLIVAAFAVAPVVFVYLVFETSRVREGTA
ncbi:hypothetical protein ACFQFH_12415 [Halobaculum halobium]|uniref:Uncharacterized protein n=1 Tax=Halobaculum halobium TaxID=3032281 RepID=A0ABD5THM6_9EURY|nr:hypothetical protein [Halobaculum sp. SYNS20]